MIVRFYIALLVFTFVSLALYGQNERHRERPMPSDTNVVHMTVDTGHNRDSEGVERFYDSLRSKTTRRGFSRMLYRSVFRRQRDTTATGRIVDETEYFNRYAGRVIGDVILDRHNIYDQTNTWSKRFLNNTHMLTRRKVIRRDLLFRSGDTVDPKQLVNNKQILLYRPYMAEVYFELVPRDLDTTLVDVVIYTRDKWSIGVKGHLKGRGRTMGELYDDNILGTGNHLGINTSIDRKEKKYKGQGLQYNIPNVLGSFYTADLYVGQWFYDRLFQGSIYKNFINPTDYELGASAGWDKAEYYMLYADSMDRVKKKWVDAWGGKSFYLKGINSSIYLTGRYSYAVHPQRPSATGETFNPAFHNYNRMLYGFGLYREKFYAANMIYGFGFQEYIPAGYRAEVIGGYNWGEFRDAYYVGLSFHKGELHNIGYIRAGLDVGTFVDRNTGKLWQTALDIELKWFSNLFKVGRSNMRQFITLNHTRGWFRGDGNNEVIKFTKENGPRTITEWNIGTVRSVLNTETVIFTPFRPLGFRTAIFGWADVGTLGMDRNVFRNNFYTTFGMGVRLKNERLTFSAIEIRVGAAVGKGGFLKNQWYKIGSEQRVMSMSDRFLPTAPTVAAFE